MFGSQLEYLGQIPWVVSMSGSEVDENLKHYYKCINQAKLIIQGVPAWHGFNQHSPRFNTGFFSEGNSTDSLILHGLKKNTYS